MTVRSDDGWEGTAIYEITGAHHHRYFPVARAHRAARLTRVYVLACVTHIPCG